MPRLTLLTITCVCASHACAPASAADPETDPGLTLRVWRLVESPTHLPRIIKGQTPNADRLIPRPDVTNADFEGIEAPLFSSLAGELLIEQAGSYRFRLTSDDGSRLTLGGLLLIDNDGRHGMTPAESAPVALEAIAHDLLIEHFDSGGARGVRLEWMTPGSERFVVVPTDALRTSRDLTRVTSPGLKRTEDGRRAGDGRPLDGVHPGWRVTTIRPDGFEPMVGAMCFDAQGRLIVGTFDPLQRDDRSLPDIDSKPPDALYALEGIGRDDPGPLSVRPVATDLYEPTGLCLVDGTLYVANRKDVRRLTDTDGDGYFETHTVVGSGWEGWNYHQFAFQLVHRDGHLYTALSTAMAPPDWDGMDTNAGPNGPMRGGIVEIDLSAQPEDARVIAAGTRTPNGLGLLPTGELIYLDNQGTWMPTSQLAEVIPGRFYGHYNWTTHVPKLGERFPHGGHPSALSDRPRAQPVLWMPQNEASNSPTQPQPITAGPFAGQVLVGELTGGGIRRVFLERVDGVLQGCIFRFTQGLECGVNRMVFGPDGSLYAGGIGAGGNWNWRETQFGLQRLDPTGELAFEMKSVSATARGLRIELTKPADPAELARPEAYLIRSWNYTPTDQYGGPKVDQRAHAVTRATADPDGLGVELEIDGLREGTCVHVRTDPVSMSGEQIWSTEAWYTLLRIPRESAPAASTIGGTPVMPDGVGVGLLPPANGATLIGGGSHAPMSFRDGRFPGAARTQDELIGSESVGVGGGTGDLISRTNFRDARIHVEWFSPPGGAGQLAGNSGVYLQDRYEIQVLGTHAGDEPPAANEAGAIYAIKAADVNASTGAGTWQAYDIWFRAPRFDERGRKTADARLTLYWNGVLVHDDVAIPRPTGSRSRTPESDAPGALLLQDHASAAEGPVRYRNVWIAPLEGESPSERGPWIDLLSMDADAWTAEGGAATFRIDEEGGRTLIGTTAPDTPNTFYTSPRDFGDFELFYEAKVDPRLNSGVQIRSEVLPDGALRGYQVELDPSERAFSAGIYDERGRGWLHPLSDAPSARRAFRPDDWNRFRVVARGPLIETWVNGVPVVRVFDDQRRTGRIGFQVHGVGGLTDPLEVRFRNIRLRELR